ncbi:hypothetical protein ACFWE5_00100 [Cellulosimicrobium funkei]|uniref:hypothetical protein n=1 Tax=Cellulosimicrobium funkei TaxID=264251 RepID=UPI003655D473
MQVTTHYSIPGPVPFLDVDVSIDKPMFVDPHAIRLSGTPQPFAADAIRCMETFFHEVTACALNNRQSDQRRGLALLQRFTEPWETRLGLAESGIQGHGGSDDVGEWIWDALRGDARMLVDVGILTQIEDIPLFVEGVAEDITSDLTTRIIFGPLAEFTAQMVAQFPQFTAAGHGTKKVERQVWDPQSRQWTTAVLDLPIADGRALLLVPRDWARATLLMSAGRFYETSTLSYVQMEQATVTQDGKVIKTRKEDLKKQQALGRGRATILEVVRRAHANGENLVEVFKSFVDSKYEPHDDDRINSKLA